MSSGKSPNPGPALRKQGRARVAVPEEDRRASDIAAVRHEQIKAIARLCVVDDDEQRAPLPPPQPAAVALGAAPTSE